MSKNKCNNNNICNPGTPVYAFGLIGALVYFLQNAGSIGEGLMGIIKALVWPALLVYKVLQVWQF
jgi:hypothetical protein